MGGWLVAAVVGGSGNYVFASQRRPEIVSRSCRKDKAERRLTDIPAETTQRRMTPWVGFTMQGIKSNYGSDNAEIR